MRITQNSMYRNMTQFLQARNVDMAKAQEQASTNKRINRLSDDSVGAGKLLRLSGSMNRIQQQMKNIDTVQTHAGVQDTTLGNINDIIVRVKEMMVQEANEVNSSTVSREAVRKETLALTEQLIALGNTQVDGQYIFGGYVTDRPAYSSATVGVTPSAGGVVSSAVVSDPNQFSANDFSIQFGTPPTTYNVVDTTTGQTLLTGQAYTTGQPISFAGMEITIASPAAGETFAVATGLPGAYNGDGGVQQVEIEPNLRVAQNIPGSRLFQGVGVSGGVDVFGIMNRVNAAMSSNDRTEINTLLADLDTAMNQVSNERSGVGARINLADAADARQSEMLIQLETARSGVEDIDLTEAVLNLTQQQTAYQATLGAAGTISKLSLMDFLQ